MSNKKPMHGTAKAIGCGHLSLGNFRKLFPGANTWAYDFDPENLGRKGRTEPSTRDPSEVIAEQRAAEQVAIALGGVNGIMHDVNDSSADSDIPAAYTFFAQFIDHDITLDAASQLHGLNLPTSEIEKLPNLRSASLDLDSVYGFVPEVSPHLYDSTQRGRLLVGSEVNGVENPNDIPRRADGTALLGDFRNDENIFLSQLHLLFLRFHNRRLIGQSFKEAQKDVRYYYQYIVLYDFLKRVCDPGVYNFALGHIETSAGQQNVNSQGSALSLLQPDRHTRLDMPVEFSTAAYRFGHTMVRSQYPVNEKYPAIELFDERFGTLGFGQVPPELIVDWRFLLDVEACHPYAKSKALDHLLADELMHLPEAVVERIPPNDRALAFRNLLRGYVLGLPSGQTAAAKLREMGYPIPNKPLDFGDTLDTVNVAYRDKLKEHTPLFFYLMYEAGKTGAGKRLGPVGSAILMEVFGSMLIHCETSFLNDDDWKLDECLISEEESSNDENQANGRSTVTLADLVRYVNQGKWRI